MSPPTLPPTSVPGEPPSVSPAGVPGLLALFLAFSKVSLAGFGGVLPWARQVIVEERRWMTPEEFNDAFALAHFLPGPNVVNLAVVFGSRLRGVPGAIVAFSGLIGPPVVVVTALGILYARFGELLWLQRALAGIAAGAAGLIVATVAKMAKPMLQKGFGPDPWMAVAVFVAIGVLRWPLPWVIAVVAPVSVALAWFSTRGSAREG